MLSSSLTDALYLETPVADYVQSAIETVLTIHQREGPGDILVFLSGQEEIDSTVRTLREHAVDDGDRGQRGRRGNNMGLSVLPLYAGLPHEEQMKVRRREERGEERREKQKRKREETERTNIRERETRE